MDFSRAALWIVMGMVAGTVIACVAAISFGHFPFYSSYFLLPYPMVALAMLAPLAVTFHRPHYRAGSIALFVLLLVFWATLLILTMETTIIRDYSSQISATIGILLIMGIPASIGLMCIKKPWGFWFAWSTAILAGIFALTAILTIWINNSISGTYDRALQGGLLAYFFLSPAFVLLINVGRHDHRYFRWPGIALSILAAIGVFVPTWLTQYIDHVDLWNSAGYSLLAASATLAFTNLLLMTSRPGLVRYLQLTAITLTLLAGSGIILLLWSSPLHIPRDVQDQTVRLTASIFVFDIGAILCMLIARTMLRMTPPPTALPA